MVIKEAKLSAQTKALCEVLRISPNWISREAKYCKWEPPRDQEYEINIDGSVAENHVGFGGIIRDSSGVPQVCYIRCEGPRIVLEQELRATKLGTELAKEKNYTRVRFGPDSLQAINIIKGATRAPWRLRNLVKRIKINCEALASCIIRHIYRETGAAD